MGDMIKVGLFIDSYYPMVDGVTSVVNNYAKRLDPEEFEVTVFCPREGRKYVDDFRYKVVRCKSFRLFWLDYYAPIPRLDRKFKKALEESDLDIVHIHSPFTVGAIGVDYARRHNIPVIATMHTQFKKDIYRTFKNNFMTGLVLKRVIKTFNDCDKCFAVSETVADIFDGYGAKAHPGVLRNCTDFFPVENPEEAAAKVNELFDIPADVPVFMFLGRITKLKNVFFIIDAIKHVKSDYRLLMVGDGKDLPALKLHTKHAGVADKVIFTGKITERDTLKNLLCRAKLMLFPSLYDASSIVQIEAASQSTPTLFLEGAATADGVIDGVNGYISPAEPEAYAQKIEDILADGETYAAASSGAKRDLYRTWETTLEELGNIYRTLIEENKARLAESPEPAAAE